jgi:hypothetical protein
LQQALPVGCKFGGRLNSVRQQTTELNPHDQTRNYKLKKVFRIILALLILFVGFRAIKKEFGGNDLGLFYEFNYIPFALLILFTFAALLLDFSFYKIDKIRLHFATSFFGLFLCCIILFKINQRKSIDNLKTLLQVSNKPGSDNVLTFEFKEKGIFILTEIEMLGQTVFYGKYNKKNDTLLLTENNYDGKIKNIPTVGIIKADTVYWNKFDTMLVMKNN